MPTHEEIRQNSLPPHEGMLQMRDLKGRVEIVRDEHGVPHITAELEHDLWFAQGFCHGQDRLWQLERFRRFARGTLSELLGESLIGVDRFYRRLGVQRHSKRDWPLLGADARKILRWFSEGVNAAIDSFDELPPEFQVLGIEPDCWSPVDSIAVWRVIAFTQMRDYHLKMFAGAVHEKFGAEAVRLLQPEYPGEAPVIVPTGGDATGLNAQLSEILEQSQDMVAAASDGVGSNNWAVDGEKSSIGTTLLAGDPHAVVQLSPEWKLNQLKHQDFDVIGASTPGVPGVLMYGHNHHVAWSVTNAMADVSDLFVERFNDDFTQYEHDGNWYEPEIWHETIEVKGRELPIEEDILVTRHGPIVKGGLDEDGPAMAHQWSGHDVLRTLETLPGSFRARSVKAYIDSQLTWSGPPMNKILADIEGTIAYQLVGDIPVRAHRGGNPVPVPGWISKYDWIGTVAFEDLPTSVDPETHYVATANNRVVDETYPHYIGVGTPWRAWRIEEMLRERDDFGVAEFQQMQLDRQTLAAPMLSKALQELDVDDDLDCYARLLLDWDGVLAPDSAAAAVYQATGTALMRDVASFLRDLPAAAVGMGAWAAWPSANVLNAIAAGDTSILQLNPATRGRSWNDVFNCALRAAVERMSESQGDDVASWTWSGMHRHHFVHNLGREAWGAAIFNLPDVGLGGDSTTVFASGVDTSNFQAKSGVSYRMIVDLDDFARSVWVLPPGQVGHPGSPHYGDGVTPWLAGDYWSMSTRREDYATNAESRLVLEPEPQVDRDVQH